ncbi:MAG: hypothetical protein HY847_10605 [Betaproteobacteria bacterium]|nr:hypothetical protein [Betaproteobacteria bacterium]
MKDVPDNILQQLQEITPKSLDDIIRTNRDKAKLYLSTEAELTALQGPMPIGLVKGNISHWSFITFFLTQKSWAGVYLTGFNEAENSSWMTSAVTAINRTAVLTRSGSIYILVGEPSTEPDLPFICATLNGWGVGQHFGVPPLFF